MQLFSIVNNYYFNRNEVQWRIIAYPFLDWLEKGMEKKLKNSYFQCKIIIISKEM